MRQLRYTLLLLLVSLSLFAQQEEIEKWESFIHAESEYQIGRIDNAILTLNENITSYSGTVKVSAYRLLALCYLAQDNREEADRCVDLLLKEDPYYSISLNDPERFAEIIRNKKEGKTTITTASQQAETLEEAPVPVTLITQDMIKAIGARTLKEALVAYVPGMTSIESNEEMNIAMRGIYSSGQEKILIMLNGHRLNSYSTNTSRPDFSISLEKVKQIEVLRGPASSLYGGVALTAVINIITLNSGDINGVKLKAGIGNYGQLRGDFLFGKRYMDLDIMSWASIYNASGQKVNVPVEEQKGVLPLPGDIIIGGFNQKPSFDVGLNLGWDNFHILYNSNYSKTVAPYSMSYFFAPYSYDQYRTFKGNAPGFAKLSHHLQASLEKQYDRFYLKATANFDAEDQSRYQIAGDSISSDLNYYQYPIGSQDSILVTNGAFQYHNWQETNWGIQVEGNYNYELGNGHKGTINAGIQWNRFHLSDSYYVEGDHFNRVLVTFDDSKNLYTGYETNADAYTQIKHQWKDLLILNVGFRYDYKRRRNDQVIHEFSPRMALILLQPKWNLKLSYAKSFVDAPYFYRNNTLDTSTGGEDLLSEYLHAWQLTFNSNKVIPGLNIESNLFYNHATDFIIPEGLIYTNAGYLNNIGVELVTSYTRKRFQGQLNLTWQHVLDAEKYAVTHHTVYNIPSIIANVILSYELFRNFKINTHVNILSKQTSLYSMPGPTGELISNEISIPSRAIWNGNINYRFLDYELGFQIHNILNKKYEQGGTSIAPIRQQGLWYTFDLSYKF